jgi:peroxiredoxin
MAALKLPNPLQDQLDAITANTRRLVPADRLVIAEQHVNELLVSGAEQKILQPGALAPDFELTDATGKPVRSADLLALGPVVLSFFRGRWCPYCMTEIEAWRELYPALRERGALFVAVSPQSVRQNDFTCQQHQLPFAVLSDPACILAEKFGLAYSVPDILRAHYRSILVNIPFINGEDSWRLPLPATFVIAQDARILFAQAFADHRVRPEPMDVLEALAATRTPTPAKH